MRLHELKPPPVGSDRSQELLAGMLVIWLGGDDNGLKLKFHKNTDVVCLFSPCGGCLHAILEGCSDVLKEVCSVEWSGRNVLCNVAVRHTTMCSLPAARVSVVVLYTFLGWGPTKALRPASL